MNVQPHTQGMEAAEDVDVYYLSDDDGVPMAASRSSICSPMKFWCFADGIARWVLDAAYNRTFQMPEPPCMRAGDTLEFEIDFTIG